MTNQEILTKAIEKAIENGWWLNDRFKVERWDHDDIDDQPRNFITFYGAKNSGWSALISTPEELLFGHSFGKALWGEGGGGLMQGGNGKLGWDDHLKFMVVADDPIAYLGANI